MKHGIENIVLIFRYILITFLLVLLAEKYSLAQITKRLGSKKPIKSTRSKGREPASCLDIGIAL